MTVTALLVSHNGARWLPAVLEGLSSQTREPDQVLAVDTGSADATLELLTSSLGAESIIGAPARTTYPEAVALGLSHLPPAAGVPDEPEWVWLLHDDCRPAPDALERLLETAERNPSVSILGPKLREWPSLRRLLEVGITMSGTGRRETGLERGEYDQGQHDRTRDVLAVNSAGMLVRREVLDELGGFDRRLPMFGNDLDFGWRAARAGHRTMVVPDAVVFHVEAAHRGVRRTPVTGGHRRAGRRAALYTLLVNCSLLALPFLLIRLVLGSLLRALGLLLVRAPRESLDEIVALLATYVRPDRIIAGRVARRRTAKVSPREVRHLLAPPWLPYRHGLDFVSDLATAVVHQAADVSSARRASRAAAETGPVPEEAQNLTADNGLLARLVSSPTAGVFAVLVLLALVGARGLLGGGFLSGGALLPAPPSESAWWSLYFESWHQGGVGSDAPAAPYLLPLAVVGTLFLGKAWLVVDVLFLLSVPLAAWGAHRFLRTLIGPGWPQLWGTVAYGLLPVVTGAVGQGRLGTVAAVVVLPWVANAALYLSPGGPPALDAARPGPTSRDRRWRAAWRTALLLALLSAFAPVAWLIALVLAGVAVGLGVARNRSAWASSQAWGPVAVAVGAVPVLLLPWSLMRFTAERSGSWYAEAGLPAADLVSDLGLWDLLAGRPAAGGLGAAPIWIGVGLAVAAAAALVRRNTRPVVLASWVVVLVALAAAVLLDARGVWAGFPVVLAQGAAVTAVAVAATGITALLSGRAFGWRQPVGLVVVLGALLVPLAGLVWWAGTGVTGPLDRGPAHQVPTYMTDAALRDPDDGVLVVRSKDGELLYTLLRGEGLRLGDDTVAPTETAQKGLTNIIGDLATQPSADQVTSLSHYGVAFVYLPPPTDPDLVGNLDSVSGLSTASALRPGSRAWQLDAQPDRSALPEPSGSLHPWLLLVQGAALIAAVVLAAPTRKVRR
ncbi:MAG TPA: glycosyltransferase family 2 protein [Nocardioidaceae bacterium]|nr:glycosyltransferase family 2 protein [Nocardioidaceae bacterium]